ncbi:putative glutamate 5-kinase [Smittium culicis]|uniref:Putative glutamate 5-kinase n=1 Tax=Smittium culicis TaxID=133412 RepID=A0A1R1Y3Y1_9FUNG|nr:putative glutamate 5-kinase [Smittium culicis]
MKADSHEKKSQRVKFGGNRNHDMAAVPEAEKAEEGASVLISSSSDTSSNSQFSGSIHSSASELNEKLAALAVDGATRHLSHGNAVKSCSCSGNESSSGTKKSGSRKSSPAANMPRSAFHGAKSVASNVPGKSSGSISRSSSASNILHTHNGDKRHLTIVLKLGSSSVCDADSHVPLLSTLFAIVEVISALKEMGHQVVLVSSGAVATGLRRLNLPVKPKSLAQVQVKQFPAHAPP